LLSINNCARPVPLGPGRADFTILVLLHRFILTLKGREAPHLQARLEVGRYTAGISLAQIFNETIVGPLELPRCWPTEVWVFR
jgi:hypothetical protein